MNSLSDKEHLKSRLRVSQVTLVGFCISWFVRKTDWVVKTSVGVPCLPCPRALLGERRKPVDGCVLPFPNIGTTLDMQRTTLVLGRGPPSAKKTVAV